MVKRALFRIEGSIDFICQRVYNEEGVRRWKR